MNYPDNLEAKIGFDRIRSLLANNCDTKWAVDESEIFGFKTDPDEIVRLLAETAEFSELLDFEKSFEWFAPNDVRDEIRRATPAGTYLPADVFIDIRENYKAVNAILRFFSKTREDAYPHLKDILKDIQLYPFVTDRIDQVFNKHGAIRDNASKELSVIRTSIAQKSQSISKRIHRILDQARKEGWVDQDTSPALRDGRLVLPVPVSNKRRISGLIHDESATGKTVFIEPVELLELNNEIRELTIAENREIIRILIQLTESIRPYFDEILSWPVLVGKLDFIRAKAKLCKRWDGRLLSVNNEKILNWKSVRHPLLLISYQPLGKTVVSQDINLDKNNRILLISGPNAGGKSVCLKTTALVQYMIQCGLLPPVAEASDTCIFKNIFIDIGDDQSLDNDLSTYSSHLLSMKYFIKNANPESLIFIDEFGTGTEPQLGAAIAQAILKELNKSGGYGVITTHYSNLKHFAASEKGIVNGAMLYDGQHMKPLFRLEIGKPGSSFAFEIAQQIGLPDTILEDARNQVGTDYIQFDKHLREISRDKRYWERKRLQIRQHEKRLETMLADYEQMLKVFEKEKKKKIKDLQDEGEQIISQINKKIENTIQEIRNSQAEKEKAKLERRKLSEYTEQTKKGFIQKISDTDKELAKLKIQQEVVRRKVLKDRDDQGEATESEGDTEDGALVPGLKIRLENQEAVGEILKVNKKSLLLSIGDILTTVPHDQVKVISNSEYQQARKKNPSQGSGRSWQDMEMKRQEFTSNIDIRGVRADEAIQLIQDLIDTALMLREKHLRILHGKGNGVLRKVIREYLASVDVVHSVRDEDVRFGGTGITLVELDD